MSDPASTWSDIARYRSDDLAKLLYRLLEQAERDRDEALRQRTLDALDGLIARGVPLVRSWIETLIVSGNPNDRTR